MLKHFLYSGVLGLCTLLATSSSSQAQQQNAEPPVTVTFQPATPRFTNSVNIHLATSSLSPDVSLRYTQDDSQPTATSALYTSALTLTNTTTLKVIPFKGNSPVGETVIATFSRVYVTDTFIPDSWLTRYFGTDFALQPNAVAWADPDQDGVSNYFEFLSGSDPVNAGSKTTFDLARDFALETTPNATWSYGWKSEPTGSFNRFDQLNITPFPSGGQISYWTRGSSLFPNVNLNSTNQTGVSGGSSFPPYTVWFTSGYNNALENFGAIRFVTPPQRGGFYDLTVKANTYLDPISSDAELHIVHNGKVISVKYLDPLGAVTYTTRLRLAPGDTLDFLSGRGKDGDLVNSGLRIQAFLNYSAPTAVYDLARDLNPSSDFTNSWSVGSKTELTGPFTPYAAFYYGPDEKGTPVGVWSQPATRFSAVQKNFSSQNVEGDGSLFPPGAVWFNGGFNGASDQFSVIRFTIPPNEDGTYLVESAVSTYLDSPASGDADFHVVSNARAVWHQDLAPRASGGYTNTFFLKAGDTLDFLAGRGPDGLHGGSGLRIKALISKVAPADASIAFAPAHRLFTNSVSVELIPSAPNLSLHYTLDGSLPGSTSALYTVALVLTNTTTLKVIPFVGGSPVGEVSTATYWRVYVSDSLISNSWRTQYFGTNFATNPEAMTWADPDQDGAANYFEFLAGTDPLKNGSRATYDLVRDFSLTNRAGATWSYGFKTDPSGAMTLFDTLSYGRMDNGVVIPFWTKGANRFSTVNQNRNEVTGLSDGVLFPPYTVWFTGGINQNLDDYGAIRFTVPPAAGGLYDVAVLASTFLDTALSRDAELRILLNGKELLLKFLEARGSITYTNRLLLLPGDTLDFLAGRGRDGDLVSSGLRIQALLNFAAPVPTFDLTRDLTANLTPTNFWSVGSKSELSGAFTPYADFSYGPDEKGTPVAVWSQPGSRFSAVQKNFTFQDVESNGSLFPPGTIWFNGGYDGAADHFGTIRFTVPTNGGGLYLIESAVSTFLDSPASGDADFHVVANGQAIWNQNLVARGAGGYTNILSLQAGDTVDFLSGRGPDGVLSGSGLRIKTVIKPLSSRPDSAPLSEGAVAWWKFEGTASDLLNGHHGVASGAIQSNAVGKVGAAFNFNGVNSRIKVADSAEFQLTNALTIEGWIRASGASTPGYILFRGDNVIGQTNDAYSLRVDAAGLLSFMIVGITNQTVTLSSPLPLREWVHVAAVLDGPNNALLLYVNGQVAAQTQTLIRPQALGSGSPVALVIGSQDIPNSFFKGLIDELALYNKPLSSSQIAAIYQAGSLGKELGALLNNPFQVTFTPTQSLFTNAVNVSVTDSASFVPLVYTLDGSEPNADSLPYQAPIRLTNHTTLKIQAFLYGTPVSPVFSKSYQRVYALADGLDNDWRRTYFGTNYLTDPRVSANADPDGDGFSNLDEYISGSDPTDPLSGFRMRPLRLRPEIAWDSLSNRTYQVQRKTLVSEMWENVGGPIRATNSTSSYIDMSADRNMFLYRVREVQF